MKHEIHPAIVCWYRMLLFKHRFIRLLCFLTSDQRQGGCFYKWLPPCYGSCADSFLPTDMLALLQIDEQSMRVSLLKFPSTRYRFMNGN